MTPRPVVSEPERREHMKAGSIGHGRIQASHAELGDYWLTCEGTPELLFTENESNFERLSGLPNTSPWVKDAFHVATL